MRAMIGLNSAVAMAPEELHWWTRFVPSLRQARGDRTWQGFLDRFVDWPLTRRLGLDPDELRARLGSVPPGDRAAVFASTMRAFAARLGKPRWGEKTPQLELFVREIWVAFPRASFVYMVRDPRDVVASMYHYRPRRPRRRIARDLMWVVLNWRESVRLASRESAAHPALFHVVRYEDLVSRPTDVMEDLCRRLGLDVEPGMLEPERFPSFSLSLSTSPFGSHEGIDQAAVGRHRGLLPPRRIRIVEWLLAAEMSRLGYEPERPALGVAETALLLFELAGAAADGAVRSLDRLVRGVPR
jgi:hypothetical protein